MIDLGLLETQDGYAYQALLSAVDSPTIALEPRRGAQVPVLLAVADLVRERAAWEGSGLRVSDEGMVFAIFVRDPELEALRRTYHARHSRLRLRESALSS